MVGRPSSSASQAGGRAVSPWSEPSRAPVSAPAAAEAPPWFTERQRPWRVSSPTRAQ
jgi:hypothetical protein